MAIVSKERVFETADKLAAKGEKPTLDRIRAELGGGSFKDISPAMQEWRAKTSAQQAAAPIKEEAPEALSERFRALLDESWTQALAMANDRLKVEREAMERQRRESEQAKAETEAFAEQVSKELEAAQATVEQLTKDNAAAASEKAQLQGLLAQITTDHQVSQAAKNELVTQVAAMREKGERDQSEIARLTGELRAAQERETAAKDTAAQALKREQASQAKADAATTEASKLKADLATAKAEATAAQRETTAARKETTQAKDDAAKAHKAEREASTKATTLQLQIDALSRPQKPAAGNDQGELARKGEGEGR